MQIVEELKKEGVVNTRLNDLGVSVIVSFVSPSPNVIICPFQLFLELILFWGISSAIISSKSPSYVYKRDVQVLPASSVVSESSGGWGLLFECSGMKLSRLSIAQHNAQQSRLSLTLQKA